MSKGGHDIPEETVRRRFERSLRNFFSLYLPLADTWLVCDNSGAVLVDVAYARKAGDTIVADQQLWEHLRTRGMTSG